MPLLNRRSIGSIDGWVSASLPQPTSYPQWWVTCGNNRQRATLYEAKKTGETQDRMSTICPLDLWISGHPPLKERLKQRNAPYHPRAKGTRKHILQAQCGRCGITRGYNGDDCLRLGITLVGKKGYPQASTGSARSYTRCPQSLTSHRSRWHLLWRWFSTLSTPLIRRQRIISHYLKDMIRHH